MHTVKFVFGILIMCGGRLSGFTQNNLNSDTMELYNENEAKLDAFHRRVGLQRLDVDGFVMYTDMDTIPQDVFMIPHPLDAYDNGRNLEENFIAAISQDGVSAVEEVFMSMRWTMRTLAVEMEKCSRIVVESDYPPVFNGLPLRVIYGRIIYTVQEKPLVAKPMVSSITIRHKTDEYTIVIKSSNYGYAKLFRALK